MSGERINELRRRLIGTAGPEEQGEKGLEGMIRASKAGGTLLRDTKLKLECFQTEVIEEERRERTRLKKKKKNNGLKLSKFCEKH